MILQVHAYKCEAAQPSGLEIKKVPGSQPHALLHCCFLEQDGFICFGPAVY